VACQGLAGSIDLVRSKGKNYILESSNLLVLELCRVGWADLTVRSLVPESSYQRGVERDVHHVRQAGCI